LRQPTLDSGLGFQVNVLDIFCCSLFAWKRTTLRYVPARTLASNERVSLLSRNVQRFRGGLVCKAHRLLYHSTLGLRVIKKKGEVSGFNFICFSFQRLGCRVRATFLYVPERTLASKERHRWIGAVRFRAKREAWCREARDRGERERENRLHAPFALHAPIQWAM